MLKLWTFLLRLSEVTAKNAEKDVRLLKLDGVLKTLENKVPSKESIDAIKEKAAQVSSQNLSLKY